MTQCIIYYLNDIAYHFCLLEQIHNTKVNCCPINV